ncbi:hypothetical protein BZA05DRAFT_404343 [Tricharina praecox]|uniref:uncharacterized protein n=1 Tax=Tricharina praecox TaxID=43433 RepID=UPI002220A44E|nr:uncharacterized protein BZA05DRAFT_404343 [Tricharina praecox]KAI5848075.1 hypothetical protein BZA05DRAFT_404343 [Tricharina praecox]
MSIMESTSTILIFRIPPMPTDHLSFSPPPATPAHASKKSRGGRGRSATTSSPSVAPSTARSRSRSTATASSTSATATACLNTKFTKYSVAALQAALGNDIERLHSFAANTELSGENILFLKSVEIWKAKWRHHAAGGAPASESEQRRRREEAQKIWRRLVDRDTAAFPLNIEDAVYRSLERVFGAPTASCTSLSSSSSSSVAASSAEEKSCIVPFADDVTCGGGGVGLHARRRTTGNSDFAAATAELVLLKETLGITVIAPAHSSSPPSEHEWMSPPQSPTLLPVRMEAVEITLEVFDKAEASVRQMVLENTWIRYVDSLAEKCNDVRVSAESPPPAGCSSWRWKSVFRKKSYTKFLGAGERD